MSSSTQFRKFQVLLSLLIHVATCSYYSENSYWCRTQNKATWTFPLILKTTYHTSESSSILMRQRGNWIQMLIILFLKVNSVPSKKVMSTYSTFLSWYHVFHQQLQSSNSFKKNQPFEYHLWWQGHRSHFTAQLSQSLRCLRFTLLS